MYIRVGQEQNVINPCRKIRSDTERGVLKEQEEFRGRSKVKGSAECVTGIVYLYMYILFMKSSFRCRLLYFCAFKTSSQHYCLERKADSKIDCISESVCPLLCSHQGAFSAFWCPYMRQGQLCIQSNRLVKELVKQKVWLQNSLAELFCCGFPRLANQKNCWAI